jgi:hypothetical protein
MYYLTFRDVIARTPIPPRGMRIGRNMGLATEARQFRLSVIYPLRGDLRKPSF